MNGCNSTLAPDNRQHELVTHSKGNVSWLYVFTRDCQYVKQDIEDKGCENCAQNVARTNEPV